MSTSTWTVIERVGSEIRIAAQGLTREFAECVVQRPRPSTGVGAYSAHEVIER